MKNSYFFKHYFSYSIGIMIFFIISNLIDVLFLDKNVSDYPRYILVFVVYSFISYITYIFWLKLRLKDRTAKLSSTLILLSGFFTSLSFWLIKIITISLSGSYFQAVNSIANNASINIAIFLLPILLCAEFVSRRNVQGATGSDSRY